MQSVVMSAFLSVAFVRFMHSLMQDQRQMLIVGLLCELEALGHSCIKLEALVTDPCALLGWDVSLWETLIADMDLPADVKVGGMYSAVLRKFMRLM
jgi:hypothetical protein